MKNLHLFYISTFIIFFISCNKKTDTATQSTSQDRSLSSVQDSNNSNEKETEIILPISELGASAEQNHVMFLEIIKNVTKLQNVTYKESSKEFVIKLPESKVAEVNSLLAQLKTANASQSTTIDEKTSEESLKNSKENISALNGFPLEIERLSIAKISYNDLLSVFKENELPKYLEIESDDELIEQLTIEYKKRKK